MPQRNSQDLWCLGYLERPFDKGGESSSRVPCLDAGGGEQDELSAKEDRGAAPAARGDGPTCDGGSPVEVVERECELAKRLADDLHMSLSAVNTHLANLDARNRVEIATWHETGRITG